MKITRKEGTRRAATAAEREETVMGNTMKGCKKEGTRRAATAAAREETVMTEVRDSKGGNCDDSSKGEGLQ